MLQLLLPSAPVNRAILSAFLPSAGQVLFVNDQASMSPVTFMAP